MTTLKQQSLRKRFLRGVSSSPRGVELFLKNPELVHSHIVVDAGGESGVQEKRISILGKKLRLRAKASSAARNLDQFAHLLEERDAELSGLKDAVCRLEATVVEQKEQLRTLIELQRSLLQVVTDIPIEEATHELVDTASDLKPRFVWPRGQSGWLEVVEDPPALTSDEEVAAEQEWQALVSAGESVRQNWVDDGLLVPSSELAAAWRRSPQALSQACSRGELFSLKVKRNRYYPAVFKSLPADVVGSACKQLRGDDDAAKFIFWNRQHEGLGGLTPADAIRAGRLEKVVQLAHAWSDERGLPS